LWEIQPEELIVKLVFDAILDVYEGILLRLADKKEEDFIHHKKLKQIISNCKNNGPRVSIFNILKGYIINAKFKNVLDQVTP